MDSEVQEGWKGETRKCFMFLSENMPRSLLQQLLQSRFPHQKINGLLEYESKMEPCQFFRKNRKCTCSYLRLDFGMVYIYRYIYRDGMAYVWKLVRLIRHQLYVQIRRSGARCALLISDPSFWGPVWMLVSDGIRDNGISQPCSLTSFILPFFLLFPVVFAAAPRLENSCHSCKSNGMPLRTS